jgi:hypothetical protein
VKKHVHRRVRNERDAVVKKERDGIVSTIRMQDGIIALTRIRELDNDVEIILDQIFPSESTFHL